MSCKQITLFISLFTILHCRTVTLRKSLDSFWMQCMFEIYWQFFKKILKSGDCETYFKPLFFFVVSTLWLTEKMFHVGAVKISSPSLFSLTVGQDCGVFLVEFIIFCIHVHFSWNCCHTPAKHSKANLLLNGW